MNELTINTVGMTEFSFKNKKLQNATMRIFKLGDNIRQKWFEVGAIIAKVDAEELYKDDGFSSVHEWVKKAFKLNKSRSYDLLKIGREYTREVLNNAGNVVGYECNLLPESTQDNFNTTQVTRMLPLGHDMATHYVEHGDITPDMTVSDIKKFVDGVIHTDSDTEPLEGEVTDAESDEKQQKKLRKIFDNISTSALIEELNKRGFHVYDDSGMEMIVNNSEKGGDTK